MNPTSYESFVSVVQATVDNSIYQKWNAATQGGTFQALTNVGTSKALQIGDTNPAIKYGMINGDKVTQNAFTGNAWQLWTTVAVDFEGGDFWYRLVNVGSGLSVDVPGVSVANNAQITQYSYQGGPNQHWRFKLAP